MSYYDKYVKYYSRYLKAKYDIPISDTVKNLEQKGGNLSIDRCNTTNQSLLTRLFDDIKSQIIKIKNKKSINDKKKI